MNKRIAALGAALAASSFPMSAYAYDWVVQGTVTAIASSAAPGVITFQINGAAGSCAQATWLGFKANGDDNSMMIANSQATLSLLLTSKMTGQKVQIFGNNADCSVNFVQLI